VNLKWGNKGGMVNYGQQKKYRRTIKYGRVYIS
jgi:hypothetical protein